MDKNPKIVLSLDTANLRKAAFAVGIGLTVGKFVGSCVNGALSGAISGVKEVFFKNTSKTKKD